MKNYTFSEINQLSGEILGNTLAAPIALTKYGKDSLVILTAERYRQLLAHPQTAFSVQGAVRRSCRVDARPRSCSGTQAVRVN